jgi:hypothetical protein
MVHNVKNYINMKNASLNLKQLKFGINLGGKELKSLTQAQ